MADRKTINNVEDGISYLREHAKFDEDKIKVEKTVTREFMELAGAPKPVQDSYFKADEIFRGSLWKLGSEMLQKNVEKAKKEKKSKEELKEITVQVTALGDANNIKAKFSACQANRIPQTGEVVEKFGTCRWTTDSKRTGVTSEDVESLAKMLKSIVG